MLRASDVGWVGLVFTAAEWERGVCACLERQDFHRLKALNEELELALAEGEGERGR